jgi:glycine/D-amino acid oxidase-like deaminating enzyme
MFAPGVPVLQQDVMRADDPISDGMSWYAEPTQPSPERPRLTFDLDVDICVIGGGLAGLTTARELARRGWSVALLETHTIASGASGRNLGFVLPGFQESIGRIIERVGLDHAKQLWTLSERGVEYVRETARQTAMPGVAPVNGWLNVSKFHENASLAAEAALLSEEFGAQVEAWSTAQVQESLNSPLYRNAVHFPRAFHIHPLNYAFGLAAAAEQAGVRIFEHTPALSIDTAGIRKRIGTPSARVRASQIVLAGSTGVGPLVPRLGASLLPVTSFVALTAPLGDKLHEVIKFKGGISDSTSVDNHYRIIDGDRLVWSGGLRMSDTTDPKRYASRLAGDMQRAYPQFGDLLVERVWSGTVGVAVHDMPQIGEIASGVWVANGFSGQGLNNTAMAGELIARGIAEKDQTWRLFSSYDLVWSGGKAGRAAMQMRYWTHRIKDRMAAMFNSPPDATQEEPAPPIEAATLAIGAAMPVAPAIEQPADIPAARADEPVVAEVSAAPVPEPVVTDEPVAALSEPVTIKAPVSQVETTVVVESAVVESVVAESDAVVPAPLKKARRARKPAKSAKTKPATTKSKSKKQANQPLVSPEVPEAAGKNPAEG